MRIDIPEGTKALVRSLPGGMSLDAHLQNLILEAPPDLVGVPSWITVLCDEDNARALLAFFERYRDRLVGVTNDQRAVARIAIEHLKHELRLARIDFV